MKIRLNLIKSYKQYRQARQIRAVAEKVNPKCKTCCEACEEADKFQEDLHKQLVAINMRLDRIFNSLPDLFVGRPPLKHTNLEPTKSLARKLDKDEFIAGLIDEVIPKTINNHFNAHNN